MTIGIMLTKANQLFPVDLSVGELEDLQNAGVTITDKRVKIQGINPNGTTFPVEIGTPFDGIADFINPTQFNNLWITQFEDLQNNFGVTWRITDIESVIITPPVIQPPPITPPDIVTDDTISVSIGAFEIIGDRIQGEAIYIINNSFDPFWFNKKIKAVFQIKKINGDVLILKQNDLFFTELERDERINLNEFAGDENQLIIDFFVRDEDLIRTFAPAKSITVTRGMPPPLDPEIPKGGLMNKIVGGLMAVGALSLLRSK